MPSAHIYHLFTPMLSKHWLRIVSTCLVIKWLPVFVAYSGNENSVYTAWRNQTECYDLSTSLDIADTTRHVRNPLIDSWSDVGIKKVKVQLVKNDVAVALLIFKGENTNIMNWFSKENLLNSSFNDLTTNSTTKFFGIQGDMFEQRQFFINFPLPSATCETDGGWLVVCGERRWCQWEQKGDFPVCLYTKNY